MTIKSFSLTALLFCLCIVSIFSVVYGQPIQLQNFRHGYDYIFVINKCTDFINFNNLTNDEIVSITTNTASDYWAGDAACTVFYRTSRYISLPPILVSNMSKIYIPTLGILFLCGTLSIIM